ncbi:hypothetical protein MRX96_017227 [Rhipicephalus microplus]
MHSKRIAITFQETPDHPCAKAGGRNNLLYRFYRHLYAEAATTFAGEELRWPDLANGTMRSVLVRLEPCKDGRKKADPGLETRIERLSRCRATRRQFSRQDACEGACYRCRQRWAQCVPPGDGVGNAAS